MNGRIKSEPLIADAVDVLTDTGNRCCSRVWNFYYGTRFSIANTTAAAATSEKVIAMDSKDKPMQGFFSRNWMTAFKRSRVAQSVLTFVLFTGTLVALMSWRNSVLDEQQALLGRRISAKFSADDFLKYQGGDVRLPPDNRGLIRYISNQIAGPSRQVKNLTEPTKLDYSRLGQSKFVDDLLRHRTGGFYVECGAKNGESQSNTLFFEKERDWDGFLIEANPWSYRNLMLKRRNAYSINACLNPTNQAKVMTFKPYGLVGGLEAKMDKKQIAAIHSHPDYARDIDVQCYPLFSIMLALGPMYIDYFALNIHGMELGVLRTIPFDKLVIDIMSIEYQATRSDGSIDVKTSVDKLNQLRRFMATKNYEEKGILPSKEGQAKKDIEANGLDVIFARIGSLDEDQTFQEKDMEE